MKYKFIFLICMLNVLLYNCKKEEPINNEQTSISSFTLIQNRILTPSCAISGCHLSTADNTFKEHKLVLEKSVSYENLFNVKATNLNAQADMILLIKPYKSDSSLLYHKLIWNAAHHTGKSYGAPMPLGNVALYDGQIEYIRRWIEAGAQKVGLVVTDTALLNNKTISNKLIDSDFIQMKSPNEEGVPGFQLTVDKFMVPANFEREIFVRKLVGNTSDVYLYKYALQSRPNSHHMVLYDFQNKNNLPELNIVRDLRNFDNSINFTTYLQMQNHIFLGGGSESNYTYQFPDSTGLLLSANYSIDLNPHYFNKTNNILYGENIVNLYTIDKSNIKYILKTINFNNTNISLLPNTITTISKNFKFSNRVKIVSLTSHTHKLATKFIIKISGGIRNGEVIYENNNWEHPIVTNFATPIILNAGEGLISEVTYNNTTSKTVNFGLTSEDEMDIIFGYYYDF